MWPPARSALARSGGRTCRLAAGTAAPAPGRSSSAALHAPAPPAAASAASAAPTRARALRMGRCSHTNRRPVPGACLCNHDGMTISVTHFTDPGCPWAYSASPALAVLAWRYGDQLDWRLATIGLTEDAEQYVNRGYPPARAARGYLMFRRRWGMPFGTDPRPRVVATSRGCRAIVATRLRHPEREYAVFRALQFAWMTTPLVMDEDDALLRALDGVPGIDAHEIVAALDDPDVDAAYEADRADARTAEGSPTHVQGKAAQTDGLVRYTAPSLIFTLGERRLEAGGFQPVEAYDVIVANLDPTLDR